MSLMKSLARVAAGVVLAKGLGSVMRNQQARANEAGTARSPRQTGGGILGDLLSNNTRQGAGGGGGLGDILGQVLGGRGGSQAGTGRPYGGPNSGGAAGGLGGILDNLTRGRSGGASGPTAGSGRSQGGLGDLLGPGAAGGLGGLLGGLLGGQAQRQSQPQNDASFGEVFNDAVVRQDEPAVTPTPEQNAVAGLLLKAMIQAAKADGKIDDQEKQRLLGEMGDLDDDDRAFIREQMAAPVDAQALAREVPAGLGPQVYTMSVMAIDVDHEDEVTYLRELAQALNLPQSEVDEIHQQIGVDLTV